MRGNHLKHERVKTIIEKNHLGFKPGGGSFLLSISEFLSILDIVEGNVKHMTCNKVGMEYIVTVFHQLF